MSNTVAAYGLSDHSMYAEGKSMHALLVYLCARARPAGLYSANVEICRRCESQCAFGREFVRKFDAGERPTKRVRKKKYGACATNG